MSINDTTSIPKIDNLFQETNSGIFQFLASTWNKLSDWHGNAPTRADIINVLPYNGNAYQNQAQHIVNAIIPFSGTDMQDSKAKADVQSIEDLGKIPFLPSTLELRWLKTFLLIPEASFLLSRGLRDKLQTALQGIQPFDFSSYQQTQFNGDDLTDQQNLAILRLICQSLSEQHSIELNDKSYIPLRLCYDELYHHYSVVAVDTETGEFSRLRLKQLQKAKLTGDKLAGQQWAEQEQSYQKYLKEHRVYLRLQLVDRLNARERCYSLFSAFDKTSYTPEDGIYHLKIFFYDFDKEDVIERILSLGATAIVEKDSEDEDTGEAVPSISSEIRKEVIRRLLEERRYL